MVDAEEDPKYTQLHDFLHDHAKVLHANDNGELVFRKAACAGGSPKGVQGRVGPGHPSAKIHEVRV